MLLSRSNERQPISIQYEKKNNTMQNIKKKDQRMKRVISATQINLYEDFIFSAIINTIFGNLLFAFIKIVTFLLRCKQ